VVKSGEHDSKRRIPGSSTDSKLLERGKGTLQRELGLTEEQAYLALQRQSRQNRRPIKEIAQAIILRDEV